MNEADYLPKLIDAILTQTEKCFKVVVCVNQPESYWELDEKICICKNNQRILFYLNNINDDRFIIIDKSSKGNGWLPEKHGIGIARKTIMDFIVSSAHPNDIIISMDADTVFQSSYFASVIENFRLNPEISAISIPYYHELTSDEILNRAMLRYEIYMRAYAINMWRIENPYCFSALGSAMAFKVWAYKNIGGMTPKLSGEDFYFLQKIVKSGKLVHWNSEMVFPSARYSDRVFFGTGPALIKGVKGDWSSYPIYHPSLFDKVAKTCKLFSVLFTIDTATPLDDFMIQKFGELPWNKLRRNFKTEAHFVRACNEKIDGLRILQFLKENQNPAEEISENALCDLLSLPEVQSLLSVSIENKKVNFEFSSIVELENIRILLLDIEMHYRYKHWQKSIALYAKAT